MCVHTYTPSAYSEAMQAAADPPRRHRLTVADYYRMAEVGILDPEARVELIDGEIIDMAPPGSPHAATVHYLNEVLVRAAAGRATVLVQNPVRLDEYNEPQPDLALLQRRDDFYRERHPRAGDVLLIVEVAATSLKFDRETKLPLYARHAIPEMWLVDLGGRRLLRWSAPRDGSYAVVDEPDLGSALEVAALPGVALDLRRLFG
jgi:Uma2 family endonuclease